MARISLYCFVVMLLGTPSCLITSTTEFPSAVASRPFLNANTAYATPSSTNGTVGAPVPVTKLIWVEEDVDEILLSAEVQSEDAGQLLYARAFVDYKLVPRGYSESGGGDVLPPSSFEDVRKITARFDPRFSPGCHQVALVVTHRFDTALQVPAEEDDTAIAIWWMVLGAPSAVTLAQCPGMLPQPELDGGAGGGDQ